jgi:hypothetical protein
MLFIVCLIYSVMKFLSPSLSMGSFINVLILLWLSVSFASSSLGIRYSSVHCIVLRRSYVWSISLLKNWHYVAIIYFSRSWFLYSIPWICGWRLITLLFPRLHFCVIYFYLTLSLFYVGLVFGSTLVTQIIIVFLLWYFLLEAFPRYCSSSVHQGTARCLFS